MRKYTGMEEDWVGLILEYVQIVLVSFLERVTVNVI
jgi:hypothetical protein